MTAPISATQVEPLVQLFILSRDRKDFCRETVASAVAQTYARCEVIVSDNSVGDDVAQMLEGEFPDVKVVRRQPTLAALDHFNHLIEEAQAPLMVLFHDDDVLEPGYIARMVELFAQNPEVAAVGCNGHLIMGHRRTAEPLMGDFKGTRVLRHPIDLVGPYMSIDLVDPAPFPGYMYRTELIRGLRLEAENGGKHSDVSFLYQVLGRAPILWTAECLFNYRMHGSNDSRDESIGSRLSWLRYVQKVTGVSRKSRAIMDYKFIYWRRWVQQNSQGFRWYDLRITSPSLRHSVARRFILSQGLRLACTRVNFWRRTWRLLMRKWRVS